MSAEAEDPTARLRALAAATARQLSAKKGMPQATSWDQREGMKRRRIDGGESDWRCLNCNASCRPHRVTCYRCCMPRAAQGTGTSERRNTEEVISQQEAREAAEVAAAAAAAYADAPGYGELNGLDAFTVVKVPDCYVGLLIGKKGLDIKQLQADTGAAVCVGKLAIEGFRKVCLTGSAEAQAAAKAVIEQKIMEWTEKDANKPITESMEVPREFAAQLIGAKGSVIRQVKDSCGVTANLDDDEGNEPMRKLQLKGGPNNVAMARVQVEQILLQIHRRAGIFNAPLENKYAAQMEAAPLEAYWTTGFTAHVPPDQPFIEEQASMWAEHYSGNLDCIDFYKKLQLVQEVEAIPGMD